MLSTSGVRWLDEYFRLKVDASGTREGALRPDTDLSARRGAMEAELCGERTVLPDGDEAMQMIVLADAIFESISTRRAVSPALPVRS